MASTKQKVHAIIHEASDACARIDGGRARVAEADSETIVPIQINMITAIALEYGVKMADTAAADLLLTFSATVKNRQLPFNRQALVGWLPGIDNSMDDSAMAAFTEAVGWTANSYFEQNSGG